MSCLFPLIIVAGESTAIIKLWWVDLLIFVVLIWTAKINP